MLVITFDDTFKVYGASLNEFLFHFGKEIVVQRQSSCFLERCPLPGRYTGSKPMFDRWFLRFYLLLGL